MCLEMMNTNTTKPEYLRHGYRGTWTTFLDPADQKLTLKRSRNDAALQKHPSREQRLAQRARLEPFVIHTGKPKKKENVGSSVEERVAAASMSPPPPGSLAPRNTTQYLMSNVYADMKMDALLMESSSTEFSGHIYCEALSPRSVSAALDSCFEDILEYQLREFEELFDSSWKPE